MENRRQNELDEEDRKLSEKVAEATWEHLQAGIAKDVKVMKEFQANAQTDAASEAMLDQKYLKERQKTLGWKKYCLIASEMNGKWATFGDALQRLHVFRYKFSLSPGLSFNLRKGQQWASQWQASNCKIVMVDENCADALAEYTRFVGQNTEGKTGRVLLGAKIW